MTIREVSKVLKVLIVALGVVVLIFLLYLVVNRAMQGEGELKVETIPSKAKIKLDGKEYTTPVTITKLHAGEHRMTIQKEGFKERKDTIKISKGKTESASFMLYTAEISPSVFKIALAEDQKTLTEFEKIMRYLPYHNINIKIDQVVVDKEPSIRITLYAILNRPEQYEGYKLQLKQYGQEALDWIKSKGVAPDKLNIIWAPSNPFTN